MTKETYERARQELGIDRPFLVQYGETMGQLVRGDLGRLTPQWQTGQG